MGGLSKKATALTSLQSQLKDPWLIIDSGNMLFPEGKLPPGEAEAMKISAQGVLAANSAMGYRFAGVAANDLAAGPLFLQKITVDKFTWLSLNVVSQNGEQLFSGYTVLSVGPLKVAVLALSDHASVNNGGQGFTVLPWQQVLPQAMNLLRPQADLTILLSNYSMAVNKEIARATPGLDLIFQSGHVMGNMQPIQINNALITQTGVKGKYLGQLDINWLGTGTWQKGSTFSHRFIPLSPNMEDEPAIDQIIKKTLQEMKKARKSS